jgi:hypothetical protein
MKRFWTAVVLVLALVFWGALKAFDGNDETYLHIYGVPSGFGFYKIYVIEDPKGARVVPLTTLKPEPRPFM